METIINVQVTLVLLMPIMIMIMLLLLSRSMYREIRFMFLIFAIDVIALTSIELIRIWG